MISRRGFLGAGLAGVSSLFFSPAWAQGGADLGTPTLPSPGFKKFKLGEMEIIALNDGVGRRPLVEGFVRNAPLDEVKSMLASQNLPTNYIDIPFTTFLIVHHGHKYLIDTGFADNGPPTTGKTIANLAAAGYKPEDIDHVLISHFHGDHINGLKYKNDDWVYPKAKIHVPAPEHAFWTDPAKMSAAPEALKGAFANVQKVFAGLPADRLVKFEPGAEVVPGVGSLAAFGHTPGHTAFTAKSGGKTFIYVADTTNIPALFARKPDWAVMFDMNADMARETRRKVFDMIAKENMLAGGFHFPFPAVGNIVVEGSGYQFKPLP